MPDLTGDLLREVARVQKSQTLQEVRDVIESIPTTTPSRSRGYGTDRRFAEDFKADVIAHLQRIRETTDD